MSFQVLIRLCRDQRGVTSSEYGVLFGLISLATLATLAATISELGGLSALLHGVFGAGS